MCSQLLHYIICYASCYYYQKENTDIFNLLMALLEIFFLYSKGLQKNIQGMLMNHRYQKRNGSKSVCVWKSYDMRIMGYMI